MKTQNTFCRICEALCGLEVDVDEGRVVAIRPDAQHVATKGYGCIKGLRQHELYDSPDRLTHPLKRVGNRFERVTWEQALSEIGAKVSKIRGISPHAVAMYVGTAAGFGVLHPVFAQGFMDGVGSRSMFSSASQDCSNKFAVARAMYGHPFLQPFPDLDRTNCLIVVGANPAISKWSFLQVPNPIARLKEIEARGARLYFVDPRRTESAKVAGEHVVIRPGTDVFFYLSFLRELVTTGGIDEGRTARYTRGLEAVAALAKPWTPERTEDVTQIRAAKLREMVAAYRDADGAALYCSTGVNMGAHGSLAFWLQEVINSASGNFDRQGGTLVGRGVIDFPSFGKKHGILLKSERSRIGNFGSVNDAFPGGVLADEILTPGDEQVRALFVTGGNPLLTMADGERLHKALGKLELLVTLDILPTETGHLAHYMLPCTSPLQRADLPFIFPLMLGLQSRPYLQATERMVPPEGEQRDEASIYVALARAAGVSLFGSKPVQRGMELAMRLNDGRIPERKLLSLLLRVTGEGSFDKLAREPHGRARPPHRAGSYLPDADPVELAPPDLLRAAEQLDDVFATELANRHRLKLITRRAVTTHNSWTHNLPRFVSNSGGTNYLYMHPADAERAGLADGDVADVTSATGTVRVPVRLLAELMEGTVALPHGWGHQGATRLRVASATEGVNVNILAASGPAALERFSGMAHLTGILVEVVPARGPRHTGSWSGVSSAP